jgi:hypothetical protein
MSTAATDAPTSRPYLAMGLTFLLLGIGFASPWRLVREFPRGMWEGQISQDSLNLYALTVFLGWAHFFYAWQGQWRGTLRLSTTRRTTYWLTVALLLVVLVALRSMLGVAIFSLVIWVYNIAHFIKAETFFSGTARVETPRGRANFYAPAIAFAWFTLVLFQVPPLQHAPLVFAASIALAIISLIAGDWRALAAGEVRLPLLTLFLLGETLVWSEYSPYMTPAFRVGVYVLHIAAASFFHYLSSYFFAQRGARTPAIVRPLSIVAVNIIFFVLGCVVARWGALWPLRYVLAPEWFTLWVALHLAGSDLLPWWKRRRQV